MRGYVLFRAILFIAALAGVNTFAGDRYLFSNRASVQFLDNGVFYRPPGRRGPASDQLLAAAVSFYWPTPEKERGPLAFFIDESGRVHAVLEDGRHFHLPTPRFSRATVFHDSFDGNYEVTQHDGQVVAALSFRHESPTFAATYFFSPDRGLSSPLPRYLDLESVAFRSALPNSVAIGDETLYLDEVFRGAMQFPNEVSRNVPVVSPEFSIGAGGQDLFLRPTAEREARLLSGPIQNLKTHPLSFGERKHWLVTLKTREGKIALVVREDGVVVRLSTGPATPDRIGSYQVDDEILTVPGVPRTIDLGRLEVEARFVPERPMQVIGEEGQMVDPFTLTRQFFPDLMQQVRQRPQSAFIDADTSVIRGLLTALLQRNTGSVALLGPSGTGKTETVRTFVRKILEGEIPMLQRSLRVLVVEPTTLNQGAHLVGTIETRIRALIETCRQVPTILFIDEFHSLRGIGTHSENSNDVIEYLKTALASGLVRIIGTSTPEEFLDTFGGDAAIMRRFVQVNHEEPPRETLLRQLRTWSERTQRPALTEDLHRYAIELTDRYNATGAEPARTIAFLDNLYASLEALGRTDAPTRADLQETAIRLYGVNPAFFKPDQLNELLSRLPRLLDEHIVGLENYKLALVSLTRIFYSNSHDSRRPAIRILAAGPPGTGKTELARVYAQSMGLPFERVEMNQFAYGDPELFLVQVARILRKNAFSVILFDEIEKASLQVQNALLAMLDHGIFSVTERSGSRGQHRRSVRVNARNATLIAATNAGSSFVSRLGSGSFNIFQPTGTNPTGPSFRSALVGDGLSEVFLDRCQYVVDVSPPSREQFRNVVEIHLENLLAELSQRHGVKITLENREGFVGHVVDRYYFDGISNRVAQNDIMLQYVRNVLADFFLRAGGANGQHVQLQFRETCSDLVASAAPRGRR